MLFAQNVFDESIERSQVVRYKKKFRRNMVLPLGAVSTEFSTFSALIRKAVTIFPNAPRFVFSF